MTLVEDFSSEAVATIVDLLEERLRRCGGKCHITSSGITRIISERFGLEAREASRLMIYVVGYLEGLSILQLWDRKPLKRVYSVNQFNLLHYT